MELQDLGYKGKRIEKLASDGITTIPELLYKEPRKYLHFDKVLPLELSQEVLDAAATKTPIVLSGKVISVVLDKVNGSNVSVIKIKMENEENGFRLYVNIFGSYYGYEMYERMKDAYVYAGGVVQYTCLSGHDLLSMSNPQLFTTNKSDLRIYPIYRKYKGISEEYYKDSIKASANLIESDYLPIGLSDKYNLMPYKETVKAIHFPKSQDEITKAQKRIVFDRMLYFASKVEMTNDHENSSEKDAKRTDICAGSGRCFLRKDSCSHEPYASYG